MSIEHPHVTWETKRRAAMKTVLLILIVQCLCTNVKTADLRLPPVITVQPNAEYIYKSGDTIKLECEATGIPDPEYTWTKNGKVVELSNEILRSKNGTGGSININMANAYLHDGEYQCMANNTFGMALSRTATVKQAKIVYASRNDPTEYTVDEGEPYRLTPTKIECFPQPRYTWKTVTDIISNDDPRDIVLNGRITLNPSDGTLLFANIIPADERNGRIYKLDVHNSVDDLKQGGSPYKIKVTRRPGRQASKPTVIAPQLNVTEVEYVGIKGEDVTLMCFFGGFPTPNISWQLPLNGQLRIDCNKHHKTRCEVKRLEYRHEAQYKCTGTNSAGSTQLKINLKIESIPTFTKRPMNTNATQGKDAVFECEADARPAATINWFSNGEKIDPQSPGNSRIIVNNNKLTVQRVCKDCDGTHGTDIQVFQCKISNKHGEAVASAYLNVLLPTEIYETSPLNVELDPTDGSEVGMMANFTCRARTDTLIEENLEIQWWHEKTRIYHEQGPYQLSENDEFLEINLNRTTEKIQKLAIGKYKCVAQTSQNNEEDFKIFSLTIKTLEVTINKETPVRAGMIEQMWWLFVVLALIFLLLICCMSCCLYAYRDRGADYEVDEKERLDGNDLGADLEELEFTEYQRPFESATLWKGSRASLGSTRHLDKSADETSIFTDHGRYEEDGMSVDNYTGSRRQLMVPHHSLSRTTVPDW